MTNEIPQAPFIAPPPSYPEIPQKPKKNLAKVILGAIVVILLGTGISLAARIWDPLWNPFRPEPEEVIEKISKKMEEVKVLHSEIKFDFEAKEEKAKETFKMTMTFGGDSDTTDPKKPKSAGNFEMTMAFEEMEFSFAGDTIAIGKDSYFNFTKFPAFPFFEMMGINFKAMQNQWIKYEEQIPPEMKEKEEETFKKLETLFKDKKFFIVKKELPDEKIRNVKTYHYLVALNKEEIKKSLPELLKMISNIPGYESDVEKLSPKIDELFEKIGEITAEIWIGKKDNYLYRIKGEKEIDLSIFSQEQRGTITIKFEVASSNFNQPVIIEPPKEFKTFEEIFKLKAPFSESEEELYKQALEEARAKARDARRMADLRQISSAMKFYFAEKGKYPPSIDTLFTEEYLFGTLFTDPGNGPCPGSYKWISNLQNPQKYCIYACLESGKFYAVSQKGDKELDKPPTNLNCW